MVMLRRKFVNYGMVKNVSLRLIGCCLTVLLCSCSEHLKTRDESLTFFFDNKKEFESLRDMVVAEKAKQFTLYESGSCHEYDDGGQPISKEHLRTYYAEMKKLGLMNISKGFIDPKYPTVDFCVSAVGFLDRGSHSVTIYFTKGSGARPGGPSKITADGWYIASD